MATNKKSIKELNKSNLPDTQGLADTRNLSINKVGIKDPDTKKRFTVIVNEKTKPDGLKILNTLKKKDMVEGRYTVTGAGLYTALELMKK